MYDFMKNAGIVNHKFICKHNPLYPPSCFTEGKRPIVMVTTTCPKPGLEASRDEATLGLLTTLSQVFFTVWNFMFSILILLNGVVSSLS